ncbi:MAG: hypothetical protein OXE57_11945 [Alphaproteobacteria bacterium]|nr:hypothetical protein [Alphaproteobacteria bacterium]
MTASPLSNRLADLAERAGDAFRRGRAHSVEAAGACLDCGRLLAEARAECGHGAWLPLLDRAAIPERTARRMMRLHRSGITAEALAEQGVKAALASMTRPAKSDTVTDLPTPFPFSFDAGKRDTARAPTLYQRRRAAGLCVECGERRDGWTVLCDAVLVPRSPRPSEGRNGERSGDRKDRRSPLPSAPSAFDGLPPLADDELPF